MKNIEKIIKKAQKIVSKYDNMNSDCRAELEKLGFTEAELGTGKSAYTVSKNISVMNINSRYFLNGKYLVVGMYNKGYGKGHIYRGMVISL